MRTFTYFVSILTLLFSMSLGNISVIQAQGQTEEVIKSIAKYTSGGADKTVQMLEKYGYAPPAYLQSEWQQYPPVRKIEMAYQAAETAEKGGGQKLLALLSKDLAQRYEAVNYESCLKFDENITNSKVNFQHPNKYGKVELSSNLKKQILTISKYTESGALGGTRGVLKHKFGLLDDEVYDILRNSKSSQEAMEMGLSKSSVPPSHEERLRNVCNDIQEKYEGARQDKVMNEVTNKEILTEHPNNPKKISKDFQEHDKLPYSASKPSESSVKTRYKSFVKSNYPTTSARKFSSMKGVRGGFGGVIFGNEVTDNTNLPKITVMKYIPNDYSTSENQQTGTLEFVFSDGTEYAEYGVLAEDVLAAHEIIYSTDYSLGDGIGLAGIENSISYLDSTRRWEAVIHPSIANLDLGWAALLADALPIASNEIISQSEISCNQNDKSMLFLWLSILMPSTWKIIDVPISISNKNNSLIVQRSDIKGKDIIANAYITMQGFHSNDENAEEEMFYELVPCLSSGIYEYNRLNNFAKTFALMRWAKNKEGKLVNLPVISAYKKCPTTIFVTKDKKLAYYSLNEEQGNLEKFKANKIVELNLLVEAKNTPKDLKELHSIFVNNLNLYNQNITQNWLKIQKEEDRCLVITNRADSILSTSRFTHSQLFKKSDLYKLDSISNELDIATKQMAEIKMYKLIIFFSGDSIIAKKQPDSLAVYHTIMDRLQKSEKDEQERLINRLDKLFLNVIDEYAEMLFMEILLEAEKESLDEKVAKLSVGMEGYAEWRKKYHDIIHVLSIENKVLNSYKKQFCEK